MRGKDYDKAGTYRCQDETIDANTWCEMYGHTRPAQYQTKVVSGIYNTSPQSVQNTLGQCMFGSQGISIMYVQFSSAKRLAIQKKCGLVRSAERVALTDVTASNCSIYARSILSTQLEVPISQSPFENELPTIYTNHFPKSFTIAHSRLLIRD